MDKDNNNLDHDNNNPDHDNNNPDHEVEEVNKLGADYFAALIYRAESYKVIKVEYITKNIVNQLIAGKTLSPRQAVVLMTFKRLLDP